LLRHCPRQQINCVLFNRLSTRKPRRSPILTKILNSLTNSSPVAKKKWNSVGWFSSEQTDVHTAIIHSSAIGLILTNCRCERGNKFVMRERNREGNIPQESGGVVQMLQDAFVICWAYHGVAVRK